MTVRTESFIVTKNGRIHHTAPFLSSSRCLTSSFSISGHNGASYTSELMGTGETSNPVRTHTTIWDAGDSKERGSHLAGCMPLQTTEPARSVSWRAWASSFLCTLPKLLGRLPCADLRDALTRFRYGIKKKKHLKLSWQCGNMITRSEALIPGVGSPRLVGLGTWKNSLGWGLDPVVNLQRWIYTCRDTRQGTQRFITGTSITEIRANKLFAGWALDSEQRSTTLELPQA